jgi:hypothetical protein
MRFGEGRNLLVSLAKLIEFWVVVKSKEGI